MKALLLVDPEIELGESFVVVGVEIITVVGIEKKAVAQLVEGKRRGVGDNRAGLNLALSGMDKIGRPDVGRSPLVVLEKPGGLESQRSFAGPGRTLVEPGIGDITGLVLDPENGRSEIQIAREATVCRRETVYASPALAGRGE